ncbi:DEAD/DEAH box helicase [Lewinella sp. LCG006]|uniref:DEAD/DEAH box helicase n=1 Tax=Lewinella sp. LCG006 TaxID=3231911 RepID=UPI0034611633
MKKIILPEILFGPIKYSIGFAFVLLRDKEQLNILETTEIQISPRVKEELLTLENGEKIIVTKRKTIEIPDGVDGVIRKNDDGSIEWIYHKDIRTFRKDLKTLSKTADAITESWKNQLRYKEEALPIRSSDDKGLRPPQIGALHALGAHWSLDDSPVTVVMPTGTGKTETMLAATAAYQLNRVLVAVPSKALREQISKKFISFGKLKSLGVLPKQAKNPIVGIVTKRPKNKDDLNIFHDCNVVVGVVSSLSGGTASVFLKNIADVCGTLIIDEAHHVAAKTWHQLKAAFTKNKVVQFTATPFRNDGKLVDGKVAYSYPLKKAQENGYFKSINFYPIYEPDLGIADTEIAKAAIAQLREDISSGKPHQMMVRCKSKSRAEEVFEIYKEEASDLNPIVVHSEVSDNDGRVEKIRSGEAKIVVCVNMLGEGVDIPSLKVSAIHDMHQSLAVLLQFIGRFTRNGDNDLGDASVIANIANPHISRALEDLYSEDADWNSLLRELSSTAAKEHAAFIEFLENSEQFDIDEESAKVGISKNSIQPTFSTLFYECEDFHPKRIIEAISDKVELIKLWMNENKNTLYFVTRRKERVKWSKTKEVTHIEWHLYVFHYDSVNKLLYLASSNKSSNHAELAKAVGATKQIVGEDMFRSLGHIGRLVFNNIGVTKHGRRNLSFAMYTGADVKQALSETEKKGARKSNIGGYGWENGKQITIGCSYKGRVWSKANGSIPQFIEWASNVGRKLIDVSIDTKSIIANVLIPEYADSLPDFEVLTVDWPVELIGLPEDRVTILKKGSEYDFFEVAIRYLRKDVAKNSLEFAIVSGESDTELGRYAMVIKGENGFDILALDDAELEIRIGTQQDSLRLFFTERPPLFRFFDLSELDGNIILRSEDAGLVSVPAERLNAWDWPDSIDITKESIWKDGVQRLDSVQWYTAQQYIHQDFAIVYDDDRAGEAADLICIKEEEDYIKVLLVHCKFSGSTDKGKRIKDVVEVSSQAIRSAKWPGKFKELIKHIRRREQKYRNDPNRTGFLEGEMATLNSFQRMARLKEIRPEIIIVQPGVSEKSITKDQAVVLGAAVAYIKQTLNVDLNIICSK